MAVKKNNKNYNISDSKDYYIRGINMALYKRAKHVATDRDVTIRDLLLEGLKLVVLAGEKKSNETKGKI